jgi:hypothetical protein
MNLFLWIVSRCLPPDELWIDELVTNAVSDDLRPMEAYVCCQYDRKHLGEEDAPVESRGGPLPPSQFYLWRDVMAELLRKGQRIPDVDPKHCVDVVLWKEHIKGSDGYYDLIFSHLSGEAAATPIVVPGVSVKPEEVVALSVNESDPGHAKAFVRRLDPVDVIQHRPVRKHKRNKFVCSLACEIKAKLGMPKRTSANILAVRHMAHTRCREVNLRAVDTRRAVELVVEMVFVPDEVDIQAAKFNNSQAVRLQNAHLAYESKSPLFRWMIGRDSYAKWSWSHSVGQDNA